MSPMRVAYIGCGAVVEKSHLPAVRSVEQLSANVLIDFNRVQLEKLQDQYEVEHVGESFDEHLEHFDIAVIATPSASHYDLGKQLLGAGKHVLMEKPLASTYEQGLELMKLAEQKQRVLAVSLVRRYLPHFQAFKSLIENSVVGDVEDFVLEEGAVFNWPVQHASFYDPTKSGGGVLLDNGAHLLDALLWWLGDFKSVEYQDDAFGGVEADCLIKVVLESGASGSVRMSRLRALNNSIVIRGSRGEIEMHLMSGDIKLNVNGSRFGLTGKAFALNADKDTALTTVDLFIQQYDAFCRNIVSPGSASNVDSPLVKASDCLASVRMIEDCYKGRSNFEGPVW